MVFAVPGQLPVTQSSDAFNVVENNKISWICNTSKKLNQTGSKYESWTIISTREFGAENKVPQENVPPEVDARIKEVLLREFESLLGLPRESIKPVFSKIQLWGAAVPLNRYNAPFVFDGEHKVGICGDWFKTYSEEPSYSGPSIESAYMSGYYLAQHIAKGFATKSFENAYLDDRKYCYETRSGGLPLGDVSPNELTAARPVSRGPLISAARKFVEKSTQPSLAKSTTAMVSGIATKSNPKPIPVAAHSKPNAATSTRVEAPSSSSGKPWTIPKKF